MAATAPSTVPKAVMRTTSTSGAMAFTARRSSPPPIPGIMRSVTTTSGRSLRTTSRAAWPESASATLQPSRAKVRSSDSRLDRSSSTMRTRGVTPGGSYNGSPAITRLPCQDVGV